MNSPTVPGVTEYPAFARYRDFKGLFVGGCVRRGVGSRFRARAHAHIGAHDPYKGWICVPSPKRLYTTSGNTSQLMRHELAHLISGSGHTEAWRCAAQIVGYRIPARYQKQVRR